MTVIRPADWAVDEAEIARLCHGYRAALAEATADRPDMVATYYDPRDFDALIADLPRLHAPPKGAVLVAEGTRGLDGIAMLRDHGRGLCEIKRLYVDPGATGRGQGKALVEATMDVARAAGHGRMVLDTMKPLTAAIRLYDRLGFSPCPPFYDLDPAHADYVLFYGREL